MRTHRIASTLFISALVLAGCTTPSAGTSASTSADSAAPAPLSTALTSPASAGDLPGNGVEGTVVRFSGGGTSIEVTIGADTPTTRDFVSLLPFTTQLEDFAGREKIGDLPRALDVQGTPGSDPEDGALIYFTPWGNLGFYYDTSGIGYSQDTPHLGTFQASEEQLTQLEGEQVTVEVVP